LTDKTPQELVQYALVMILGIVGLIEDSNHLEEELDQISTMIHKALDQCEKCKKGKGVKI